MTPKPPTKLVVSTKPVRPTPQPSRFDRLVEEYGSWVIFFLVPALTLLFLLLGGGSTGDCGGCSGAGGVMGQ